jgi:hypothetical protein
MFKTIYQFTSSFAALLSDQNTIIDVEGRLEAIRAAMLDSLMEVDAAEAVKTWEDVDRAVEIQTLWYLRSEVMQSLSTHLGEEIARKKLDAITKMFQDVVPANQMPSVRRFTR